MLCLLAYRPPRSWSCSAPCPSDPSIDVTVSGSAPNKSCYMMVVEEGQRLYVYVQASSTQHINPHTHSRAGNAPGGKSPSCLHHRAPQAKSSPPSPCGQFAPCPHRHRRRPFLRCTCRRLLCDCGCGGAGMDGWVGRRRRISRSIDLIDCMDGSDDGWRDAFLSLNVPASSATEASSRRRHRPSTASVPACAMPAVGARVVGGQRIGDWGFEA